MWALNWNFFCNQRIEPDPSVIREFYANLWPNNIYSIFVRERQVSLNPRAINQLFGMYNYNNNDDDYSSLLAILTYEMSAKLLQEVTVPGTQWILSKQGSKTCRRDFLTTEAIVWFYFLRHSLMPTGHTSSLICLMCRASRVVVAMVDDDYYSQGTISTYDLSRIMPTPPTHPPHASSQIPQLRHHSRRLPVHSHRLNLAPQLMCKHSPCPSYMSTNSCTGNMLVIAVPNTFALCRGNDSKLELRGQRFPTRFCQTVLTLWRMMVWHSLHIGSGSMLRCVRMSQIEKIRK